MAGHDGGMHGMAPPEQTGTHSMAMHMTFFWGKNVDILFKDWPGNNSGGMYVLALFVVFFLAMIVEWLSHSNIVKQGSSNHVAGMIQTLMHGIRVGLAYIVMLAVMSFNGGVLVVAVAGHSFGFLVFGSRVFRKSSGVVGDDKVSDLPPLSTC
ncbi:copper transporter 6-like [Apium graveolens]|uniref:copper transporter 6-like n=1 Tax=Apium graveolens TaxID=4045 RepID=UPI003D7B8A4E